MRTVLEYAQRARFTEIRDEITRCAIVNTMRILLRICHGAN